jgi:hypothetical protein
VLLNYATDGVNLSPTYKPFDVIFERTKTGTRKQAERFLHHFLQAQPFFRLVNE